MGRRGAHRQGLPFARALATVWLLSACHSEPTRSGEDWPVVARSYALRAIDNVALPTTTGPDSARVLIDSARLAFIDDFGANGFTLTPFSGGTTLSNLTVLISHRVAADSFVVDGIVPGGPPPELFLAVRDSTLSLYWRPPASGVSLASRMVGRRNQIWTFRAR